MRFRGTSHDYKTNWNGDRCSQACRILRCVDCHCGECDLAVFKINKAPITQATEALESFAGISQSWTDLRGNTMGKGDRGKGARTKAARAKLPVSTAELRRRAEIAKLEHDERQKRNERNPDHFGMNEEALKLQAFSDVEIKREKTRKAKPIAGWRTNVFTLLAGTGTLKALEADAGQRLLVLYAEAHGLDGGPDRSPGEFIDKSASCPVYSIAAREKATRAARERLGAIWLHVGPSATRLLQAYCVAIVIENRPIQWAGIVQRVVGDDKLTVPRCSERVRMACESLAEYFHEEKRRAA